MNFLDISLLLSFAALIVVGSSIGFLRLATALSGAWLAIVASTFTYVLFVPFVPVGNSLRLWLIPLIILPIATLGFKAGWTIGAHLNKTFPLVRGLSIVNRILGASATGGTFLIIAWTVSPLLAVLPLPTLRQQHDTSKVLSLIRDQAAEPPSLFLQMRDLARPKAP